MDRRQMTPKGQMSGNGSGPAIAHLPPNMKAMFTADAPLDFKAPINKRKMPPYQGIAQFVGQFETTTPGPRDTFEDPVQRQERRIREKAEENEKTMAKELELFDPHKPSGTPTNGDVTGDAYKTLFVARVSYDTTQHKLRREFEQFGTIKTLRLVQDQNGECRGYAFIEYEKEADMKEAYKRSNGRKIDGRRVVVDVERGRTVRKWKPRRFGGGLGNTRAPKKKGDKPGPSLSGRTAGAASSSSSSGHYGSGGAPSSSSSSSARPDSRPDSRPPSGGGGSDRYGPSSGGGGGGGGGDRYGPSNGGGGGGDRYGPGGGGGGGDRRRERSRSR
mmetsp:Transcript_57137/g.107454  ORF Transcript_57137/g.107454 Transcript_57137/m.107454 type:complete len:331 (-) Transcript_57137:130-1122(-)